MAKAKAKKKVVKKATPAKKAPAQKKPVAKKKAVAKKAPAPAKKTPAKKKAKAITEKSLGTAITEMNDIGDWEPPIKTGGTEEEMSERIKAELSEVLDDDPFTPETWAVLKELGYGSSEKKKKVASKKKGKEGLKKVHSKKKSIINTLIEIIEKDGPITRKAIHTKLVKLFPNNDPKVLESRVRCQVPGRLNIERNLGIVEDKKERFSIK